MKQLSELIPHRRVVTYLGACYAEHPQFREKCLYVFTEFMPGVSTYLIVYNGTVMSDIDI